MNTGCKVLNAKNQHPKSKISNEEGFILVVTLLLLLVVTVLGLMSISSSTSEVMIAGNLRARELNLTAADGGIELMGPIIENTLYNNGINWTKYPVINTSPADGVSLISELTGTTSSDDPSLDADEADVTYTVGDTNVLVDVDYSFSALVAGSAVEFAAGYEGIGKGASSGGSEIFYKVNSYGTTGSIGAEVGVGSLYRYVSK